MLQFQYLWNLVEVILRHSPKWWFMLFLATAAGFGFAATYSNLRPWLMSIVPEAFQPVLPVEFPLWWLLWIPVLWVTASLAHQEALRRNRAARLSFEKSFIGTFDLKNGQQRIPVSMAKIRVRNNPANSGLGMSVHEAHCTAEFRDFETEKLVLTVEFARWTENPKPRPDYDQKRFFDPMRYRTLEPNNAPHTIDFAIKHKSDSYFHGFGGLAQEQPSWKSPHSKLDGAKYRVKIRIEGVGLNPGAEVNINLANNGAGADLECTPA